MFSSMMHSGKSMMASKPTCKNLCSAQLLFPPATITTSMINSYSNNTTTQRLGKTHPFVTSIEHMEHRQASHWTAR